MRAFVFSGGGAFAVSELGFVSYIIENKKFNPHSDIAVGTSFGAISAATLCTQMKTDQIKNMLLQMESLSKKAFQPISLFWEGLKFTYQWGLVDLLNVLAPYFGKKVFPPQLKVCTTDVSLMKPKFFTSIDDVSLVQAVAASASIPFFFRPQEIRGKLYVDGGMVENTPTSAVSSIYSPIVLGSLPQVAYHANVTNLPSYMNALLNGLLNTSNLRYTKKIENATYIPIISHAQHVFDFSHWEKDFMLGYSKAEDFFDILDKGDDKK